MSQITIRCKILAIREGHYTHVVVEDLNREFTDDLKYITAVIPPNWTFEKFQIEDVGFLQFESVVGGETEYFDRSANERNIYMYTNNYFMRFIKEQEKCKQEKFEF